MARYLIIKLRYIGDTITLIPLVRAIKQCQAEAEVQVMIYQGTEGILAYQHDIDEVILIRRDELKNASFCRSLRYNLALWKDLRKKKFDVVIDLTSSDRTAILSFASRAKWRIGVPLDNVLERLGYHELIRENPRQMHIVDYQMAALKKLGISVPEADMHIHVPSPIEERVRKEWLVESLVAPLVVLHPGARRPLRQWREERFAQIADRLVREYQAKIVLVGSPEEQGIVDRVAAHMEEKPLARLTTLSLIELAALLKQARLFIGNDTSTGHIAAGVGTRHVVLFGPQFPKYWAPRGAPGITIWKSPSCCGCRQISCLHPNHPCMDWISVDEVWDATTTMMVLD